MELKFKRLHNDATLPNRAYEHDAGFDLIAIDNGTITTGYIEYSTGLAVEIPKGYVGLLLPRSSISNYELMLKNSVGVIDSGYRNDIKFRFQDSAGLQRYRVRFGNLEKDSSITRYKKGDKVGQLVVLELPEFEAVWTTDLAKSDRGTGGWGSSDKGKK